MNTARTRIAEALDRAAHPAVLFSGGKDSLLLLALAREVRVDISAVWFRTGEPDTATRQLLTDWNVPNISWEPADIYLLAQADDRSLVQEYAFGDDRLPVVSDLSPADTCSLHFHPDRTPIAYPVFDVLLWGAKDADTHWIKGAGRFREDGFMLGNARLYAPLRHMTDDAVRAAIGALNLNIPDQPDTLPLCTRCMEPGPGEVFCPEVGHYIQRTQWEADRSLTAFRTRFGLETPNGTSI